MRLAKLVRRETCAEIAAQWDVGPHVALGLGEARGGGRKKAAILSDVCESLIGAVFVDGGFEAAEALVVRAWGDADRRRRRPRATPRPRCRNGRSRARSPRPATRRSSAAARRTRPISSCAWCSKASSRNSAQRARSGPPNRPRRRPFSTAGAEVERDALRVRRAHRRAQRRQIDAHQRARRRKGLDRHPQGADDALDRARRDDQGRGADRVRRHAWPVRAQAPPRPGDGRLRLERGGGRRRGGADDRRPEGGGPSEPDRGDPGDPRRARRARQAEARRPQQDRPRRAAEAARTLGQAQRRDDLR